MRLDMFMKLFLKPGNRVNSFYRAMLLFIVDINTWIVAISYSFFLL